MPQPNLIYRVHAEVKRLAPLPTAAQKLIGSLAEEDPDLSGLASSLSLDPVFSQRTLGMANSPHHGLSRRVNSVEDSIVILGTRRIRQMLVSSAIVESMPKPPGFDTKGFWRHSIATALAAQEMAREIGIDPYLGFSAGLLHDVGHLLLANYFTDAVAEVARYRGDPAKASHLVEQSTLGFTHATVGGLMVIHWGFPGAVAEAVARHHVCAATGTPQVSHLLLAADAVAQAVAGTAEAGVDDAADDALASGRLVPKALLEHAATRTRKEFEALCDTLLG